MPAFRIVYTRRDANTPETITAGFDSLEQALNVFAARGLRIIYIAEQTQDPRRLERQVRDADPRAERKTEAKPRPSSFPLRRFSARVMA
jgi:hypothetical protein